jgi:glucose-1-phosphate thymidylyltransferase
MPWPITASRIAGLADAFLVGSEFVGQETSRWCSATTYFYGHGLPEMLAKAVSHRQGATVFGYAPEQDGVMELTPSGRAPSIEEKPK